MRTYSSSSDLRSSRIARTICQFMAGMLRMVLALALMVASVVAPAQTVTYFHNDASGTPILATDAAGNLLWKENYRPYGDRLNSPAAAAGNSIGFAGRPFDASTGLSYAGARYYDPAIGRFLGTDPAPVDPGSVHGANRYAYANNNPYRFVDPDGNSPIDVAFLVFDLGKLGVALYKGEGIGAAALDVAMSTVGVVSPVPFAGQGLKAARATEHVIESVRAADHGVDAVRGAGTAVGLNSAAKETVTVQRWMSKAELKATQETGLLRGGRDGTHYVTDAANSDPLRARQRLALDRTPEVRATLEVPSSALSTSSKVNPKFNMSGGGRERTASGNVPTKIIGVD